MYMYKKFLKKIGVGLLGLIVVTSAYAASTLRVPQGGTGVKTITGIVKGNGTAPFSPITIGTGLSLVGSTLSATGGVPSAPLYSVQYNYPLGTFGSDALFTRNPLTGETGIESALTANPFLISGHNIGLYNGTIPSAYSYHSDGTQQAFVLTGDGTSVGARPFTALISYTTTASSLTSQVLAADVIASLTHTDATGDINDGINATDNNVNIFYEDIGGNGLNAVIVNDNGVTISNTGAASPNYTLPFGDGNANQVPATNGVGQLTFQDITALVTINDLLPNQATHAGEFLNTDGTNPSWQPAPSPSLTSTQVAFGSVGNTITSSPDLTFIDSSDKLLVDGIEIFNGGNVSTVVVGQGAGASLAGGAADSVVIGKDALAAGISNSGQAVILGSGAAQVSTDSQSGIAIGYHAASLATSLGGSVFLGTESGLNNTGINNFCAGTRSCKANLSGMSGTYAGYESGLLNDDGDNNSYFGNQSGLNGAGNSSENNSLFGNQSGLENLSGGNLAYFGNQSGMDGTNVSFNSYFGASSGLHATGSQNSYFGFESGAGDGITPNSGLNNLFGGYRAGVKNQQGTSSVLLGHNSGFINEDGNNLVCIGASSCAGNVDGSGSVMIGASAGAANNFDDNIGIGSNAYYLGNNGQHNIAIGQAALANNFGSVAYSGSVAIGYFSLNAEPQDVTTNNTAVGYRSGIVYEGSGSTFVGYNSGQRAVGGTGNTGLGSGSCENVTSGEHNTCLGFSNQGPSTGSRTLSLGALAGMYNGGQSDSIAIGFSSTARADHQLVIGSELSGITTFYLGEGVLSGTPANVGIFATGSDGAAGNDIAAGSISLNGGASSGNATAGSVLINTTVPGSSGNAPQAYEAIHEWTSFKSWSKKGQRDAVRVVTAAGAVTVVVSDYIIVVNKSSGAATTVNLPSSPATGDIYIIKDGKGDSNSNNITLTPAAGNIDGGATYVMNINYQSITLVYNGTEWNII